MIGRHRCSRRSSCGHNLLGYGHGLELHRIRRHALPSRSSRAEVAHPDRICHPCPVQIGAISSDNRERQDNEHSRNQ